ncbi:hypothetical protein ACFSL4_00290 [Streptomyces caeni]|uniref:Uncharacterized protein n=1 Tax=Streptomyces caeni TaxID=2307231 RepID=A0ABW4IJM0_9ACTN
MLRIHFTPQDLQNTRLARRPDPLWEPVCATCRLETGQGPLEFGRRRRSVRTATRPGPARGPRAAPPARPDPQAGRIPDFLTGPVTGEGLDAGLDPVRRTPRARLAHELTLLASSRPVPGRAAALGGPGGEGLASLTNALGRSFRPLLEPHWAHVRAAVGNDVALRSHRAPSACASRQHGRPVRDRSGGRGVA